MCCGTKRAPGLATPRKTSSFAISCTLQKVKSVQKAVRFGAARTIHQSPASITRQRA